jgi:hypothetical protein
MATNDARLTAKGTRIIAGAVQHLYLRNRVDPEDSDFFAIIGLLDILRGHAESAAQVTLQRHPPRSDQ